MVDRSVEGTANWRAQLKGDKRLTPASTGEGRVLRVIAPLADLRGTPRSDRGLDTQLLHGEAFRVIETREGWAYGQAPRDDYVGYVPEDALSDAPVPTHAVSALRTLVFPEPDIKVTPMLALSMNAQLAVAGTDGRFAALSGGGFVPASHIVPIGAVDADFAGTAAKFLGVPYWWGGRSSLGLDCSGLVQMALMRAGIEAPRDTDMQEKTLGTALAADAPLARGDLVFWKGHVGLMLDAERLLHANAFHMAVAIEPIATAHSRILAGGAPVTSIKRL